MRAETGEDCGNLEGPDEALARDLVRPLAGDVLAVEEDRASRGRQKLGQEIEAGGLACAVRPDHRMNGAAADLKIDVADRGETAELLAEPAGREDDIAGGWGGRCHAGASRRGRASR
jgi:hypothetical protein